MHAAANLFGMKAWWRWARGSYAAILSVTSVGFCALLLLLPALMAYGWSTVIAELRSALPTSGASLVDISFDQHRPDSLLKPASKEPNYKAASSPANRGGS